MLKQYILTEKEAQEFAKSSETIKGLESLLDLANLRVKLLEQEITDLRKICSQNEQTIKEQKERIHAIRKQNAELEGVLAARECIINSLKSERVCIANFPPTGAVKVISVVKADTYRKHGWIVSEEFLVDRPA